MKALEKEIQKLPKPEKIGIMELIWADLLKGEDPIQSPDWHHLELEVTEKGFKKEKNIFKTGLLQKKLFAEHEDPDSNCCYPRFSKQKKVLQSSGGGSWIPFILTSILYFYFQGFTKRFVAIFVCFPSGFLMRFIVNWKRMK